LEIVLKTIVYDYSGKAQLGEGFQVVDMSSQVIKREPKPPKPSPPTTCEICGFQGKLVKDRSKLGRRGFICKRCNFGLLYFGDSVENLGSAIRYLEKYEKATI
jgi:hypothetical protein